MTKQHLRAHQIDQLLTGEALAAEVAQAEAHAATCATCAAKLDDARTALQAFAAAVTPETGFAKIATAATQQRRRARLPGRSWLWVPSLAAVAAVAVMAIEVLPPRPPEQGDIVVKGGAVATFWLTTPNSTQPRLANGVTVVRPGDKLQIEVTGPGAVSVSVLEVTHGQTPTLLGTFSGRERFQLPNSLEIDAGTEVDRLVVLLSAPPLDASAAIQLAAMSRENGSATAPVATGPCQRVGDVIRCELVLKKVDPQR